LLEICLQELADPVTLRELGTALYLDRPFGASKPNASLDLTPLLSYELFSRSVVYQRMQRITNLEPWLASNPAAVDALKKLEALDVPGLKVPPPIRSSQTVKLQDCWRIADDFVVRRPTPATTRQLRACFDWEAVPAPFRDWHQRGLMPMPVPGVNAQEPTRIVFYDAVFNPEFECRVAAEDGFERHAALELPKPGMVATSSAGHKTVVASRFPKPVH
jgi:hypothetical protein